MAEFYGKSSIPYRWKNGAARILWIGDSIVAQIFGDPGTNTPKRVFRPTKWTGGVSLQSTGVVVGVWNGTTQSFLAKGTSATDVYGDSATYSPYGSVVNATFNGGNTLSADAATYAYWLGDLNRENDRRFLTDTSNFTGKTCKITALLRHHPNAPTSPRVKIKVYDHGGTTLAGESGWIQLNDTASGDLQAHTVTVTMPSGKIPTTGLYYEGGTIATTNGQGTVEAGWRISCGDDGMECMVVGNGGWKVSHYIDTSLYAANAWKAIEAFEITDVAIWLGQNGYGSQAQYETLIARMRAYNPNLAVTLIPSYKTGSSPYTTPTGGLATNRDEMIATAAADPNACVINLYEIAGSTWFLDTNYLGDHVHPNATGYGFFSKMIWDIVEREAANHARVLEVNANLGKIKLPEVVMTGASAGTLNIAADNPPPQGTIGIGI